MTEPNHPIPIGGGLQLFPHRELRRGREPLAIGGRALAVLTELAQAGGALVSKDQLMERVWPNSVVEDNALQAQVSQLRKVLGPEAGRLVVVHGRGYRLELDRRLSTAAASATPLIAVLAFENRSSDPELEFFAEGVSEEILQAVARTDGVRVIARTSSFQLKGDQRNIGSVAATLGATHILDGSVRREGDRLRIAAQLVESVSETVLWSNRVEGTSKDVFAMQDTIARSVADVLKIKIRPGTRRISIDPQAYDFYLQGRRLTGPDNIRGQSIACFESALEIEPEFSLALGSLALAQALVARWGADGIPFQARASKARSNAEKALALDPTVAVAHIALGILRPKGDYLACEEHFERALQLSPNDSEVLRHNAILAYQTGRINKAFQCAHQAFSTDMLNPAIVKNYGVMMADSGRLADSYTVFEKAQKRWPELHWFHEPIIYSAFSGDWNTLDVLLARQVETPGLHRVRKTALALRHPTDTSRNEALSRAIRRFERLGRIDVSTMIFLYALGLRDESFALLMRSDYSFMFASDGRNDEFFFPGIQFSIVNQGMRGDPRFVDLCDKLGLCAYWRATNRWPDCVDQVPYDFRAAVLGTS